MQNRAKKPGPNNSNVFALAASQTRRQDRSYYKSLYNFNADVELAEYSLPVMSSLGGRTMAPGVANTTKLPPIQEGASGGGNSRMQEQPQYDMDGNQVGYGMDMEMQMDQMDDYDDEEPDQQVQHGQPDQENLKYDEFSQLITSQEDADNNKVQELTKANFIKKGTAIYNMQTSIKTGTHAIAFFAKHGITMPIKFLNCNRRKVKASEFRPYDLEVIEDEKCLNSEYFTVSSTGVVQICQTEAQKKGAPAKKPTPTEFLSLAQWTLQSTMFNVLTSMKFFKNYLITKVFDLWKGNVRYHTYNKTRIELSKNLIQQRRDFQGVHIEINKQLYTMEEKLTFLVTKRVGTMSLEEFKQEQDSYRTGCRTFYNEKVETIVSSQLSKLVKTLTEDQTMREEEDLESSQRG